MLTIALIAACAAVMRATLVLGIPLAMLSIIALARTTFQIATGQSAGRRISAFDKVITFFVQVAIVLMIFTPVVVAFVLLVGVFALFEIHPVVRLVAGLLAASAAWTTGHRLLRGAIQEGHW
jgi:hypothetical protein